MAIRPNPNQPWEVLKAAAAAARLPFDKDTWLNLAFYLDEQYVEWGAEAATILAIPRPEGGENLPRPVQNKIMHFVAQEHAFALDSRPTPDVLPTTDDPVDISDASVSLAYLRWLMDEQNADFDGELADATLWALVGGEGYLKWVYDPERKRGDIISCSPLDVYVDPYCTRFKNARYVIHSQFMDVEQVYDIYGKEIKPSQLSKADPMKAALLRDMGTAPVLSGAVVNELWMKPCRRYPQGLFTVWSDREQLVERRDFPYKHGHLPFTQIGSIPRPGSPHYTCAVKYLRGPQMELNKYHAQRISIRENFANPKWFLDAALELEADPDNSPNQILRGNSQGGQLLPMIIQPTMFPGGDEGAFIVEEMMNTVGLHEVSQGQVPGRVESSKAIELLKESDRSRLAELTRTIKGAVAEGGWQQLELARQFVSEEILLTTYSRDGIAEVKKFKGGQVSPGQRVNVTMGTGLARSRAAREEQVINMWDRGIVSDPETVAELLDLPVGAISPNKAHDIRLARNENFTLADGKAVAPNGWDDHAIHIREHNNYRKSTEFLGLDEESKNKFAFHVETHETLEMEFLQKELQKQIMLQQLAAGPVPPEEKDPSQSPQGIAAEQNFVNRNIQAVN